MVKFINYLFFFFVMSLQRMSELFGPKPLLVGVYTSSTVEQMVDEILLLNSERVSGVYIENVHKTPEDIDKIKEVLSTLSTRRMTTRVGVNILPDLKGTEFKTAYDLATKFKLPFVALDLIAGDYSIKGTSTVLDPSYDVYRHAFSRVFVIGGIETPYATMPPHQSIFDSLELAAKRCDAVMVKAKPDEDVVPESQFGFYRLVMKSHDPRRVLPLTLASKGTPENIHSYASIADAFIIGSGVRNNDAAKSLSVRRETIQHQCFKKYQRFIR